MRIFIVICVVVVAAACGKDKSKDGAAAGGPSCAEAAAGYAKVSAEGAGNPLANLKPTPEQLKTVTDKLEAHCTANNWAASAKKCVLETKSNFDLGKCFHEQKDLKLQISQVIFDAVKELKGAAPAAGSGDAGSAAAGSADAGSAAGGSPADSAK